MDVREKLVELINEVQETGVNEIPAGFGYTSEYVQNEEVASHLIAHGVTVQEWISVNDRLPEEKLNCIVHYKHAYCDNDDYWEIGIFFMTARNSRWICHTKSPIGNICPSRRKENDYGDRI